MNYHDSKDTLPLIQEFQNLNENDDIRLKYRKKLKKRSRNFELLLEELLHFDHNDP